jgi:hypothetical protein
VTPELWNALAGLIDKYGLPIAMLGGFLWLILRGKLVTGSQLASMTSLFERERSDRIAAEAIIAKFAAANADVAEAVAGLSAQVLKRPVPRSRRPVDDYVDRVEGVRRGR